MATASISLYSNSQSGNNGNGRYEFGYTAAITGYYVYVYSTYKFTLSSATNLLSLALNYKILGSSKTVYWRIDQSSSNSDSFTADGSFSSGAGGSNSYTSYSKTIEKSGTFAAGTYYLHLRTNGSNAGYGYLSSGTVTYNAVATYTVTLNANGGTVPALTSVSAGNSGGTLAKGVSVPVIEGSTIALTQNQEYLLEFSYKADSATNFHVDLFPDTLPQTMPSATTALQRYSWNFSSSSADIKSCKLRFFNDLTIPNPTNIYISTVKLYKVGSGTSSTSKTVENGSKYGQLPTPTRSGYQFNGWYTASSGGTRIYDTTSVSLSGNQTLYAQWIAYRIFDINGRIDGGDTGDINGYGHFDLYINGTLVGENITDYYNSTILNGSTYEIRDLQTTNSGYKYTGATHALSGTITADTTIFLQFEKQTYRIFDINGRIDGCDTGGIEGYGTFDLYINGSRVGDNVADYYNSQILDGSTYEINDIQVVSGYEYVGATHSLSGTVTSDMSIFLCINKQQQGVVYIKNSSGAFEKYQVYIANSSGVFEQYKPMIYTSGAWADCGA